MRALAGLTDAVAAVTAAPRKGTRRLVALSGPPASGKSTLAARLSQALTSADIPSCVVPMDGFHLDNSILIQRGLLNRKGAPETFDAAGFAALMARCAGPGEVIYPTFDRTRDIAIAGSSILAADIDTVVVEGNYLMMQTAGWRDLAALWDVSICLEVPDAVLLRRLTQRWLDHGLDPDAAATRADGNDMVNARTVARAATASDFVIRSV